MYLTLCNPMDYTPSGSSVLGIFQARLLVRIAISYSRGSSWSRDRTWVLRTCIGRWILHDCATWKRVCVCVCICIHTNMCNNMVVSQKYAECKEPHAKRIQTVWFNLYEVVEKYASLYSDRKDIGGFLGQRSEIKGRMEDGGMWRNFSEDKTCYILIEVVGIRVCLYVKNQQTEPLK